MWTEPVVELGEKMLEYMKAGEWRKALEILDKFEKMLRTYKDAC
jgi:hypothetical protein